MNIHSVEDKEKIRRDGAKKAVALAMQSRWEDAVVINRHILKEFPEDLEAHNRLGKALTELGRSREAKWAFQHALEISPYNGIAKKNLDRLTRLGDETPRASVRPNAPPPVLIEESGKAGVTSLITLASHDVLLRLAPGHPVQLQPERDGLKVALPPQEFVGQVEPRLASRLMRLIGEGNRYEATVTSVGDQELTIIIREVYKHPSQAKVVSFPSRLSAEHRMYGLTPILGYGPGEEMTHDSEPEAVKDWSDDDTEPGDDDAFAPVIHRIIKVGQNTVGEEEGGF